MYEDIEAHLEEMRKAKHPSIQQTMLKIALDTLTPKQKKLWDMYAYDRLTQEEIAEKLGIKRQSVAESITKIEAKVAKYVKHNRAAYMLLKLEHQIMNEDTE